MSRFRARVRARGFESRVVSASAPAFDPATLSLTGWVRAGGYNAGTGTWTGVASAGASGSRNFTEATNKPAAGSNLNGLATVSFNGSQYVGSGASIGSDFFTSSAWSASVLVNPSAYGSGDGTMGTDAFWGDLGGYIQSGLGTASAHGGHVQVDGVTNYLPTQAMSLSTWQCVQVKYDGTNVKLRVNSGAWQSVATGGNGVGDLTTVLQIGQAAFGAGSGINGLIADFMCTNTALSDANMDNIKSYYNSRYALSL